MTDDLNEMLKEKAQLLQQRMQQAQRELTKVEQTVKAGATDNAVTVVIKGDRTIKAIKIDDNLMHDKPVLEDLVASAVNKAIQEIEEMSRKKVIELAKDVGLPTE